MKNIALLIMLLLANKLFAQQSIQTTPAYKGKAKTAFTEEWQYLSTDLYLFNTGKFNDLINQMVEAERVAKGKKNKKNDEETIESLFITANLKDVKFFGGDLTYPIYNFQVKMDEKSKYKTQITNNQEVVRIIDNLPLASSKDYIDAVIQGQVISNRNKSFLDQLIASQLLNISTITNPSGAVLSLVGEFGKFMNTKANGLQYNFNSTIRLYESMDFNKKLHSVYVYVFTISGNQTPSINTSKLEAYLDTATYGSLDYKKLEEMVQCQTNPFIVITNYKSKYNTEAVIGDEVNFESINQRAQKTKQAYEQGLMNKETNIQEMKLIEFLQSFAKLKVDIDNYKLNYKNNITNNFAQNYFVILSEFRNLKNILQSRDLEYSSDAIYKNEFRKKYVSIIMNAELYLEADNNLKNIKECVNSLFEFETKPDALLTAEKREIYLRKLYSVELPKTEAESNEAKDIKQLIGKLEIDQYSEVFKTEIQKLKNLTANDENLPKTDILKIKANTTYCQYCKDQLQSALSEFQDRYEAFKAIDATKKYDETVKQAKDDIYNVLIKESCISNYMKTQYPDSVAKPEHIKMIIEDFNILKDKRIKLSEKIKQNMTGRKLSELEKQIDEINAAILSINEGYASICKKVKAMCECEN